MLGASDDVERPVAPGATGPAMVALYPPREIAEKLALPGGEKPDVLHVTLVYLGDQSWTPEQLDKIRRIVARESSFTLPIRALIAGSGVFTEGEKPVLYLSIDAPGINRLRERIFTQLKSAGIPVSEEHSFTPHMTLRYGDAPDGYENPRGVRFTFNDLAVAVDDDRFASFPLAVGKGERPDHGTLAEDSPFWDLSLLAKKRKRIKGKFAKESGSLVPHYDPSKLTFGKFAGGSNGARIATHANGSKWLVKRYGGHQDRVATEVLSNAIYREMGARVPKAGLIKLHNGDTALSYPLLDGKPRKYVFRKEGPSAEVGKHFMTDALLANWDVAGLEDDNILWDKKGKPFRVDQGGTLEFRAQGQRKGFGPVPYEVVTMRQEGGQSRRSAKVTSDDMREQAAEIRKRLSPQRVDALVDAAGFRDPEMRERVRQNLKARVAWMGGFADGLHELPEPPAAPPKPVPPKPLSLVPPWDPSNPAAPPGPWKKPDHWGKGKLWEGDAIVQLSALYMLMEGKTLAAFKWLASAHPRDQHGKFIDTIQGLNPGEGFHLGSEKTRISREKDGLGYRVVRSGAITKGFLRPDDAARYALDVSAKGSEPESVGGGVKHAGYNAYLKAFGLDPTAANQFGGKSHTSDSLAVEVADLEYALKAMEASPTAGSVGEKRAIKSTTARLVEAKLKLKKIGAAGSSGGSKPTVSGDKNLDSPAFSKEFPGGLMPDKMKAGEQIKKNGILITASGDGGTSTPTKWMVSIPGEGAQTYTDPDAAADAFETGQHGAVTAPDSGSSGKGVGSGGTPFEDSTDAMLRPLRKFDHNPTAQEIIDFFKGTDGAAQVKWKPKGFRIVRDIDGAYVAWNPGKGYSSSGSLAVALKHHGYGIIPKAQNMGPEKTIQPPPGQGGTSSAEPTVAGLKVGDMFEDVVTKTGSDENDKYKITKIDPVAGTVTVAWTKGGHTVHSIKDAEDYFQAGEWVPLGGKRVTTGPVPTVAGMKVGDTFKHKAGDQYTISKIDDDGVTITWGVSGVATYGPDTVEGYVKDGTWIPDSVSAPTATDTGPTTSASTPFTDMPTGLGTPRRFFHGDPTGDEIKAFLVQNPTGIVRWGSTGSDTSSPANPHRIKMDEAGEWDYINTSVEGQDQTQGSLDDLLKVIGKNPSSSSPQPAASSLTKFTDMDDVSGKIRLFHAEPTGDEIKAFLEQNPFGRARWGGDGSTTYSDHHFQVFKDFTGDWRYQDLNVEGTAQLNSSLDALLDAIGKKPSGAAPSGPEPYSGKKIKGFQENTLGVNGMPAPLNQLDIAIGDVIQYKKGGWKYTVTGFAGSSIKVEGPNGKPKTYSGFKGVQFVQKADGSPVKLKGADAGMPSAPAPAPSTMSLSQIKGKLSSPSADTPKMGDLPDGTVIQTPPTDGDPDGKIAVLALSEDAYQKGQEKGYVKAYDLKTGLSFEPPNWVQPHKFNSDPDVIKAAKKVLEDAQNSGTVSTASGTAQAGTPGVKTGPPAAFDGIPAWHQASVLLKQQQQGVVLTSDEKGAVKDYSGSGYKAMNGLVRNSTSTGDLHLAKKVAALDRAITKAGTFEKDVIIGRKTNLVEWQNAQAGQAIRDNGFLSTSTDQGVWSGNIHLKILARKGTRGLILGSETIHSASGDHEAEVILARGTQFEVLKREDKSDGTVVLYVQTII